MKETQKSQDELDHLLSLLRQGKLHEREIYRTVQLFGENNFLKARPEVEALLQSDAPDLRFVALKVLTRYCGFPNIGIRLVPFCFMILMMSAVLERLVIWDHL